MIKDRWGDRSGASRQAGTQTNEGGLVHEGNKGGKKTLGGKARAMTLTAITRPALAAVVEAQGSEPWQQSSFQDY